MRHHAHEKYRLNSVFIVCLCNNNCRKSDPQKRLSRWKMGMTLLPIVWTDLLKAFIHRGGLFVVDMVSPLILRLMFIIFVLKYFFIEVELFH